MEINIKLTLSDDFNKVVFDKNSLCWTPNREYNLVFLKHLKLQLQDKLDAFEEVYFNEALELLGLPRTKEGSVFGWSYGHGAVDFDILENEDGSRFLLEFTGLIPMF